MTAVNVQLPEKLEGLFKPRQFKVMHGGRGGGKSHGVAQWLILEAMSAQHRILCVREVQKSLAESSMQVIKDYIKRMGVSAYFDVLKTEIRCHLTGSTFAFSGLKDHTADSIKSFEGATRVWVEEAHSVTPHSWNILIPTIVRTEGSEIVATFNPDQETDYVYDRFVKRTDPDAWVQEINWRDNPWFNEAMDTERLKLRDLNADLYQHVWEGKCRTLAGLLFKRAWIRHYDRLPSALNYYIASDYAGEPDYERPESEPDFTEHGVWGVDEDFNLYAVDWWFGQTSPDEWIAQWARLVKRYKPLVAFEEKGIIIRSVNGAINRRMQEERAFTVREGLASAGSKLERAYGFAALLQSGKVYLPKPEAAPWVTRLVEQLCAFHGQGGQVDDGVDVCSLMARGLDEVVSARVIRKPERKPDPTPFTADWFEAKDRAEARGRAGRADYYR